MKYLFLNERIKDCEFEKQKLQEGAIEAILDKENQIFDLKSKLEKKEAIYQQKIEQYSKEIAELNNQVMYFESDEYFNYLEEEFVKHFENEKNEMIDEIENLKMQLNSFDNYNPTFILF